LPGTARTTELYVYGVTWAGGSRRRRGAGVAGGDVDVVEHGELAAVVSAVSDGPVRAKRRDLMRHMEVLQEAFKQDAILPLQFGSVFPSREVLVEELLVGR